MCFQARVLLSRSPKKGKKRRLTSNACNKSVFPICDGIDALISLLLSTLLVRSNWFSEYVIILAGVCPSRIQTVSQNR